MYKFAAIGNAAQRNGFVFGTKERMSKPEVPPEVRNEKSNKESFKIEMTKQAKYTNHNVIVKILKTDNCV